jgi:type II secretory pathway component PulF
MTMQSALTPFRYRAVDPKGRRVRGVSDAASESALTRELEGRGLIVIEVGSAERDATAGEPASGSRADVLEATRALAALLAAGVPLARALTIAATIVPTRIAVTLEDVRTRISAGGALADALGRHPRTFSPLYRGVVRAGERSGDLATSFEALAIQLDGDARVRARLQSATIYPALLAVAGTITVAMLVFVVLPRFAELLEDSHSALPASTAALLAASRWLTAAWPVLLGALLVLATATVGASRTDRGRRAIAELWVRTPVIGALRRHVLAGRFARLLAVLLGGGAPLLTALEDTFESLADPLARDEVARVRARVREGRSLHGALEEGDLFPPVLARLVAVGEESGSLRDFLGRSAEMCETRAERTLERLVALIEPTMIVAFGILIAFVALSLLQAIYGVDASSFQ